MAIAYDASSESSTTWSTGVSSLSWTHTVTGSNPVVFAGVSIYDSATVSSGTYNSAALTKIAGITANLESANQEVTLWYRDAPSTGANTLAMTFSGSASYSYAAAASYTGKASVGIDAFNTAQNTSSSLTSPTCNVNVVQSDCWLVGFVMARDQFNAPTASTGTVNRQGSDVLHALGDSNGVVSTGNQTLAWTKANEGSNTWPGLVSASFSAAGGGGGASGSHRVPGGGWGGRVIADKIREAA
jgi:hypothetical protein